VKFEYSDSIERRLFLDSKGNVLRREDLEVGKHNKTVSMSIFDNGDTRRDRISLWNLDEDKRIAREIYLNGKGEKVTNDSGISEKRYEYDSKGNLIATKDYDSEGKLAEDEYFGIAIFRHEYDDHGNRVQSLTYGVDGRLKEDRVWGCAVRMSKYDEAGNETETSYYGTDGRPTEIMWGFARWQFDYDSRGNMVEVRCYGSDGQLTENFRGVAVIQNEYDDEGNYVTTIERDKNGKILKRNSTLN
jgi:YD repeat-containing protein